MIPLLSAHGSGLYQNRGAALTPGLKVPYFGKAPALGLGLGLYQNLRAPLALTSGSLILVKSYSRDFTLVVMKQSSHSPFLMCKKQNPRDAQNAILKNGMRLNGVLVLVAKKLFDPREHQELENVSRSQSSISRTSFLKLKANVSQQTTNAIQQESNNTQPKANNTSTRSRPTNLVDFVHGNTLK
jgi:hypothetical protein